MPSRRCFTPDLVKVNHRVWQRDSKKLCCPGEMENLKWCWSMRVPGWLRDGALKGRDSKAQGVSPGNDEVARMSPERAKQPAPPLQGCITWSAHSQGSRPGLSYGAPSGLAISLSFPRRFPDAICAAGGDALRPGNTTWNNLTAEIVEGKTAISAKPGKPLS